MKVKEIVTEAHQGFAIYRRDGREMMAGPFDTTKQAQDWAAKERLDLTNKYFLDIYPSPGHEEEESTKDAYFTSENFKNLVNKVHDDLEHSQFAPRDEEHGDPTQIGRKIRGVLSDVKYRYLSQAIKEKVVHALGSYYGLDEPTYQSGEVQY